MKKEVILLTALIVSGMLLFGALIGFKNPINIPGNIEQNYFVLAVGIDKATEKGKKFKLTVSAEKFAGDSSKSSSTPAKAADVDSAEGTNIFDIIRSFSLSNSKSLFWGHIKYIIISEEVAKEDILNVLDFFIRDHELRLNATVVIMKDSSAESFLRMGENIQEFVPDLLDGLFHDVGKLSISSEIRLIDILENFDNKYSAAFIPRIKILTKKRDEIKTDSKDASSSTSSSPVEYCFDLNGYATFDGVKMQGYISDSEARGFNFIMGKIESAIIKLKDKEDKDLSIEIITSESAIKINFNGDVPEAKIDIKFSTNLSEMMTLSDIFNEKDINKLQEDQNQVVKKEAESAIKYSQENDIDIMNISGAIYHQFPLKWDNVKDNWKEILKTMKITVNTNSTINRTYHIRESIRNKSGDTQ